jgi:hypothetical protein
MDEPERREFLRALAIAAAEATVSELSVLLEGGWRERKTAAWLIAVAARTEFRDRIGELLLASEVCFAGRGYAVALASFGTEADAQWLAAYLDRYLPRLGLFYDQAMTLGALLHVDDGLGTDHAARFLEPGGLWQQWLAGPPHKFNHDAQNNKAFVGQLCGFVAESVQRGRLGAPGAA